MENTYRCIFSAFELWPLQQCLMASFFYLFVCFNMMFFYSVYSTLPNPVKSTHFGYKHQPGKIADFTPGHSSGTDKERREVSIFWIFLKLFFCFQTFHFRNVSQICRKRYIIYWPTNSVINPFRGYVFFFK